MKTSGFLGIALCVTLAGCTTTKQPPAATAPLARQPTPTVSPAPPTDASKSRAAAEIDAFAASIDRDIETNPQAARFFTGFLVNEGGSQLDWAEYATEKQRESNTKGGYPDTWTTVERTKKGQIYVSSLRGMTSGIGRYETAKYYFRSNGTLAKLVFLKSSPVSTSGELTQYYDEKGKLLYSSISSREGKATKLSPEIYRRVSALPVYRWLKKSKPNSVPTKR